MKKLGFTLIELLAVILILGIIALIAIPTVNNIIKESKRGAFKTSVQNIVKGIEEKCRIEQMKGETLTSSYTFDENGATPNLDIKGSLPTSGAINIDDECNVTVLGVTDDNYVVSKPQDSDDITIKDKEESNIKLVEAIMRDNKVGNDLVLPITEASSATDKLFLKSQDDDGTTYYFRGNIDNNYVQFGTYKHEIYVFTSEFMGELGHDYFDSLARCQEMYAIVDEPITNCVKFKKENDPMLWQIVRINGDGTIRMILQNGVGDSAYNANPNSAKHLGYTYDRENNSVGTNSTVKNYIDNWYQNNIGNFSNLDNLVATTRYCNDTSNRILIDDSYKYGFWTRKNIDGVSPTYSCPKTDRDYGGEYTLKVGLITLDELSYAGLYHGSDNYSYLPNENYWTMTPLDVSSRAATVWYGNSKLVAGNVGSSGMAGGVCPVINLKADVLITSGNGTADNPYVININ